MSEAAPVPKPRKWQRWPPGGVIGPLDDYPGLDPIIKQHRVTKPTEVPWMSERKRRTEKRVQVLSPGGDTREVLGIHRQWQGNYAHPADTDTVSLSVAY
jgi:hypothetical protein